MKQKKEFQKSLELLQKGEYERAEIKLKKIVKNEQTYYPALTNLGTLYLMSQRSGEGIKLLKRSIEVYQNQPIVLMNIGAYLFEIGEYYQSIHYSYLAIKHEPNLNKAKVNLAHAYKKLNNFDMANKYYELVLGKIDKNDEVLQNYIESLIIVKDFKKAIEVINESKNKNEDIHFLKAICLKNTQKTKEAISVMEEIIKKNSNNENYLEELLLTIYKEKGHQYYLEYLKSKEYQNKVYLKFISGKINYLEKNYKKAEEELTEFNEKENRKDVDGLLFLAFIETNKKNYDKAINYYEQIINNNTEDAKSYSEAMMNYGQLLLYLGDYEQGWSKYKYRFKTTSFGKDINNFYNKNLINKIKAEEITEGKNILLLQEQGLGDLIIYLSVIIKNVDKFQSVTIKCDKRLFGLIKQACSKLKVIDRDEITDLQNYDCYAFVGQIAEKYVKKHEDIKTIKEIIANRELTEEFKKKLNSEKINIGISWKSSNKSYANKSASIEDFTELFENKKFNLINLQYGEIEDDLNILKKKDFKLQEIKNLDLNKDIDGLISLIQSCDAVVTTSNITAHLAGCVNKKTYLLCASEFNQGRIWYWPENFKKNKTPWYESIQIINIAKGDWSKGVGEIIDLEEKREI